MARALRKSTRKIIRRIRALPQELKDMIADWTLYAPKASHTTVVLDEKYVPPVELRVFTPSRDAFAARYYSTTTFVTPAQSSAYSNQFLLSWLGSLEPRHRGFLQDICVEFPGEPKPVKLLVLRWLESVPSDIRHQFGPHEPCADDEVLRTNILIREIEADDLKGAAGKQNSYQDKQDDEETSDSGKLKEDDEMTESYLEEESNPSDEGDSEDGSSEGLLKVDEDEEEGELVHIWLTLLDITAIYMGYKPNVVYK